MQINKNILEEFKQNGYIVAKNVFSPDFLSLCKKEILSYKSKNSHICKKCNFGISIPDFVNKHTQLKNTISLKDNANLHHYLEFIFGGSHQYRFCQHNDIGIDRVVGWHKDKLNGKYEKYQVQDIWSENGLEGHKIVKVLIYLDDHSNNKGGLQIVPGSHIIKEINSKEPVQIYCNLGDVIIFDQRITHRGTEKLKSKNRILVSFGFGANNIYTEEFEKGTILRQNEQNQNNNLMKMKININKKK